MEKVHEWIQHTEGLMQNIQNHHEETPEPRRKVGDLHDEPSPRFGPEVVAKWCLALHGLFVALLDALEEAEDLTMSAILEPSNAYQLGQAAAVLGEIASFQGAITHFRGEFDPIIVRYLGNVPQTPGPLSDDLMQTWDRSPDESPEVKPEGQSPSTPPAEPEQSDSPDRKKRRRRNAPNTRAYPPAPASHEQEEPGGPD